MRELYARAVLAAVKRFGPVELIGCHGQTIFHEGRSNTLQIGEPAVLAERTGVPVVSNFRARDIAAGGQGAPLVPFVDYLLFRHPRRTRVALNIGGIANITVIPAGCAPEDVIAFDTGPGNMVIDALAREFSAGKLNCDRGGRIAASGNVNRPLLDALLRDAYYRRKPPKSAGREQYGVEFIARLRQSGAPLPDLIATATVLTAATIAIAVQRFVTGPADLIASGGGTHNPADHGPPGRLSARGGHLHVHRSRHRRRCQGSHRVRRPGARDMAPQAVESAIGHRRAKSCGARKYYTLKNNNVLVKGSKACTLQTAQPRRSKPPCLYRTRKCSYCRVTRHSVYRKLG